MLIFIIIWSLIYSPFQFAYLDEDSTLLPIDIFERIFDVIFLCDVLINFRTVYYRNTTGEAVTDAREIAVNYL